MLHCAVLRCVQENIRGVLSLMKANHPADCMNCDASGKCEFQVGAGPNSWRKWGCWRWWVLAPRVHEL